MLGTLDSRREINLGILHWPYREKNDRLLQAQMLCLVQGSPAALGVGARIMMVRFRPMIASRKVISLTDVVVGLPVTHMPR